jgi:hypothetical protein
MIQGVDVRLRASIASLGLALSLIATSSFAQNISGVVSGTVKDPAGSVVPNAQITLTNQSTSVTQAVNSNESGAFIFQSVLPGTYSVDVSMSGFRSWQIRDVAVTANERRSLGEIVLQVGQLSEKVEVTAQVTPVQTT